MSSAFAFVAAMAKGAFSAEELEGLYVEDKYDEFKIACDDDSAVGCHSLGQWFAVVAEKPVDAFKVFKKNCLERGHGNSCLSSGLLLLKAAKPNDASQAEKEIGLVKSYKESLSFFKKACECDPPHPQVRTCCTRRLGSNTRYFIDSHGFALPCVLDRVVQRLPPCLESEKVFQRRIRRLLSSWTRGHASVGTHQAVTRYAKAAPSMFVCRSLHFVWHRLAQVGTAFITGSVPGVEKDFKKAFKYSKKVRKCLRGACVHIAFISTKWRSGLRPQFWSGLLQRRLHVQERRRC